MPKRIFISAGETSGDKYAALLARAVKQVDPTIQIDGLGGPAMAAAGVNLLVETVSGSAMTIHGAKRIFEVSRWLKMIRQRYAGPDKPDLHVCVDSSAFNLPFARIAKESGVRTLYYVAPQLWASREGRIKQMRRHVDRLACIFPFEEEWFRERGVDTTFVGHPLFDELPQDRLELSATPPRFPQRPPVIGIVPGSRDSEVRANLPRMFEVMRAVGSAFPSSRFVIPTTVPTRGAVEDVLRGAQPRFDERDVEQGAFDDVVPGCDLVLTKSGTSTVHVAAYAVPMIVVYAASPVLWHALGRWLVRTKKIAMVNILAGQFDLVPEFVPWYGSTEPVARCAIEMLRRPAQLAEMRRNLIELIEPLARVGASANVARIAVEMLGAGNSAVQLAAQAEFP